MPVVGAEAALTSMVVVRISMEAAHATTVVVRTGTVEGHAGLVAVAITVAAIAVQIGGLPPLV
ncbi:hypothetical protein AB4Z51_40415 [Bradyrhizobium sp. 2TAF36]|uniref:hypothetical protein n=1 Tax=Bradyrhizobium sp. 2TAF36 TaxID=3233016 RepID=UPI003F935C61